METSKPWFFCSLSLCLVSTIVSYIREKQSIRIMLVDKLFVFFYLIVFVVSVLAPYTNVARLELFTLLTILYFCFRITLSQNNALLYWLTFFMMLSLVAFAFYGVFQYFGLLPMLSKEFVISGVFTNHGIYAGYIVVGIPLGLYIVSRLRVVFSHSNRYLLLYIYWLLALILLAVVAYDLSELVNRAVILALIISIPIVLLGIYKKKIWNLVRSSKSVSIVFCVLLLFFVSFFASNLYNRSLSSSQIRYKVGLISLNAIKENPWGAGIGGFVASYKPQQIAYNKQAENKDRLLFVAPFAYNEYLQIGVEYGVVGLLTFVALIFSAVYTGFVKRNYGFVAALVCLQVYSMMWYPYLFLSFVILLLFLLATSVSRVKKTKNNPKTRWLLMTISVLALLCLYRGLQRELALKTFENPDPEKIFDYQSLYPLLMNDDRFMGDYYIQLNQDADLDRSQAILQRSIYFSSVSSIYSALSRNYMQQGDTLKAEQEMLNYYWMNPGDTKSYYVLCDFYLNKKDLVNAQKFIDKIKKIDTKSYSFQQLIERKKRLEITL